MLLVETKLYNSSSHGIGCFANEFIKKGTKIWEFNPEIDLRYTEKDLERYPETYAKIVRFYGFTEKDGNQKYYVFCGDHARHINHSDKPNLLPDYNNNCDYAARDIEIGDELTANYYEYYDDPDEGLHRSMD